MSQPSASVSAPQTSATSSSSDIERIFDAALKSYKKKTKKDLKDHDLFKKLENCDSPAAILTEFQAAQFDDPTQTGSDERLKAWLVPTLNVLCAFSDTLGEGVSLAFAPAKTVFAGVGVLLLAAKGVTASRDILIDIFGRIENFFVRLEIHTKVPLTQAMTDKMVQITVEILDILATATKEMQQSAGKKFLKRVVGWTDLEDGIKKLDKLTTEEVAMATAQLLKNVTEVNEGVRLVDEDVLVVKSEVQLANDNIKVVDDKVQTMVDVGMATARDVEVVLQRAIDGIDNVKLVNDNVKAVGDMVQTIANDREATTKEVKVVLQQAADGLDLVKRTQLRASLRTWQSPPDPSTNHCIAVDRQHEGTAVWFIDGDKFRKWMATGTLLWIHGKAGSGKSILCSAIIKDVTKLCKAGLASMAYFYFDFRDVNKKSRRNLLPSLLVQLSNSSDAFCDILSRLYETRQRCPSS